MEEAIALDSIQAIAASFGASFDAEKIVDSVLEKDGTRYYKVRWIKYSWEPAASFAHLEHLIRDFWSQFGQNPDTLQDLSEKQDVSKQISHNLVQVLGTETSEVNQSTIPSILTAVSNIIDNVGGIEPHDNFELQQNIQLQPNYHHLSNLEDGNDNITSAMQEITLPTQEVQKSASQVGEITNTTPIAKQLSGKKTRNQGEKKKRRKIPGNCSICGKHFKSTTNIAAHKKLHTEERQYECKECGRKFRRKLHLVRHQESHAGIKSYVCDVCGSFFSSKWYMQAHAVIHTGDKPYQCDVCQKCFNNKANLNKHKLIHANNRPFVCNECGRSYRQSYDLKRHMTTHSESKSFACTHCNKSFARKTYLQRHMITHSGEKKFNCDICPKKFFQRGHLTFHMKKLHGKGKHIVEESGNDTVGEYEDDSLKKNLDDNPLSDNLEKQVLHETNEGLNRAANFLTNPSNPNGESLIFLAVNENDFSNADNSQVISSKEIYREDLGTPMHNLSSSVDQTILPQKCLIIQASDLPDKPAVMIDNCSVEEICLDNSGVIDVNGSGDINVNPEHDLEGKQDMETHNSDSIESIQQSEQDVAISLLTTEQTGNYFSGQDILEINKEDHLYI